MNNQNTDNSLANNSLTGLTAAEVKSRIDSGLVNGDLNIKTKTVWQIFAKNTFTFFNIIFVVFAIIMVFFIDKNGKVEVADFANFGFLSVVIVNLSIGLIQEIKAKRTIDKLSLLSAPKVTVIRDSESVDILLKDIVMDDVMLLSSGRQICADSVITEGSLEVNESLITGEPDAVPKEVGDELLSGSFVISGKASAKVIHIGKDNYAIKISSGAKYIKAPNSEVLHSLSRFIKLMTFLIVPLGIALFLVKYLLHEAPLNNAVLTVLASLVGMIPSGLMMLTSAVFCVSVIRLAKHKTLAQDLYCTETLARVDVLCLDKTGTLTEGRMAVHSVIPKENFTAEEIRFALKQLICATGDTNPTAAAITEYTIGIEKTVEANYTIPFSSARKWSAAGFDGTSYILGAAEFIIEQTDEAKAELCSYSENGYRIIALARVDGNIDDFVIPKSVVLMGYIVISDIIRKEAPDTLRFFREQGVTIKIISGDNPITVKSIAKRAGLEDADNYVDAATLTTDELIEEAADKYTVFGRVSPDQKLKLVKALKKHGHTVGMTGDGVNDVLALRESDCSVAMAAGSDAAKNVSQLVLLDSNFASMPKVVAEGRRSINNLTRSASLFLVKTMYNFILALAFLIITSKLPFLPKHLTLIGMVTIGIPSAVLALEPNKERVTCKFFAKVTENAMPAAIAIAIGVILTSVLSRAFVPNITDSQLSTVCVIVTAALGFAFIAKISLPFNAMRLLVLLTMIGVFVAVFFVKLPFIDFAEFFGLSKDFTKEMIIITASVAVGCLGIFVGLIFAMRFIAKKKIIEKVLHKLKI